MHIYVYIHENISNESVDGSKESLFFKFIVSFYVHAFKKRLQKNGSIKKNYLTTLNRFQLAVCGSKEVDLDIVL